MARILVVDDDVAIRRLLQRVLSREGYTVETAGDGAKALSRIQEAPPDLLLLDLMMPVMDGWEVYRRLRQDRAVRFPILIITAGGIQGRAVDALAGVEIIAKPFDLDQLLQAIKRNLRKARSRRRHKPAGDTKAA